MGMRRKVDYWLREKPGDMLHVARQEAGLSMEEVSLATGVGLKQLSYWENGIVFPRWKGLSKLESITVLKLDWEAIEEIYREVDRRYGAAWKEESRVRGLDTQG